jgi:hypothetical protein
MTKSQKILSLLKKGKDIKEIAKIVRVKPAYVYYIRWKDKNGGSKKKPSKIVESVKQMKQALDAIEKKPTKLIVQPQYKAAALKLLDMKEADLVNKPPHYTTGGIDFLDYAEAKGLTENAYLFNVVKYVSRAGKKVGSDPVQDLEKALFYLQREINIRKEA